MECKFLMHGVAVDYFGTIKPCCIFRPDQDYRNKNSINDVDLVTWHQSTKISEIRRDLSNNVWPQECGHCQETERQNRGDSMRLNAQSAYIDYRPQDITLEIRSGSVCNFACQTCWPQASSRVAQFYRQAKIDFVPNHDMDWDFRHLEPISQRLRDVVILGGEPFYDRRCLALLDWLKQQKIDANLTIFTNGSALDRDFLREYQGRLTLVFSIDAVGPQAEYIRFGSDWQVIEDNYWYCRSLKHVHTRVNVTTSPYNYHYLPDLIEWLAKSWPEVVSFGYASTAKNTEFMDESVFPLPQRFHVTDRVNVARKILLGSNISKEQRDNALNALGAIVKNLADMPYDPNAHQRFRQFVLDMDRVKNINIEDYLPEVVGYLDIRPDRLAI